MNPHWRRWSAATYRTACCQRKGLSQFHVVCPEKKKNIFYHLSWVKTRCFAVRHCVLTPLLQWKKSNTEFWFLRHTNRKVRKVSQQHTWEFLRDIMVLIDVFTLGSVSCSAWRGRRWGQLQPTESDPLRGLRTTCLQTKRHHKRSALHISMKVLILPMIR